MPTRRSIPAPLASAALILGALLCAAPAAARQEQPIGFTLRTVENPAGVRVIIEFTRRPDYEIRKGRRKVFVALNERSVQAPFKKRDFGGDILRRIRFVRGFRSSEIVFYTEDQFGTFSAFEMGEPFRIILDLRRKQAPPMAVGIPGPGPPGRAPEPPAGGEGAAPGPGGVLPEEGETAPPPEGYLPPRPRAEFVVVLDPGHGGDDTGARGPSGLVEKDVTLDVAMRLRGLILQELPAEVILTRESDVAVPLDERTAIANHNHADLFVSIHANASRRGNARGAETYFLSYQATDDEARAVAAIENNTLGLDAGVPDDSSLQMVLWDIAQSAFLKESSDLAEVVQDNLNDALGIANRGIKQAPFRVLMGATMPAVLIEVAFISNPDEERRLRNPAFKDRLASAILESIARYHDRYVRERFR
ncbi:MAG: N-acetylmuramoyl-L-alanine amidase [Acidobacteriota bacterium]